MGETQQKWSGVQFVLSGMGGEVPYTCLSVQMDVVQPRPELDTNIEEADIRLIPHALHASSNGAERLVVLSNDTDVLVALLHHCMILRNHGLQELWMKAGIADTTQYIPVHTLAVKKSHDICRVLPAIHALSGCDSVSKFGTKLSALKADPVKYLTDIGNNSQHPDLEQIFSKAEEYLIQVLRLETECKTLDLY